MRKLLPLVAGLLVLGACQPKESADSLEPSSETLTGSVIFIHPDGSGASMWGALRLLTVSPDGMTNWDRMTHMGLYRSHQLNSTNSSSHAGATVHAFGVKVPYDTYGNPPSSPIKSASGQDYGIMVEAMMAGMPVGIINSGHICEPGTGVCLANSDSRKATDLIS